MKAMLRAALLAGISVSGATAAWAQIPAPAPAPAEPTDQSAEATGLQDIVVTAQRREENLQKVPVAVTAVSAAQLADLRITNIRNLSVLAPGLQINTQGRQTVPTISIRGISSGSTIVAVDPKIGIYVDGVYVGRVVGSVFDLADIDRVEVLRGPQGTLFGRNATGGAISVITAAPTGEFGVSGTASYGNYDAKRLKVSLNLPKIGPISARISYLHDEIEGDVRNLIGGQTFDLSTRLPGFGTLTAAKKLGGRNVEGVLVSLRGDFGAVQADYRFDYTDQRTVGRIQQSYGVLPADTLGQLVAPIIALQPQFGGITNLSTSRLDAVANANSVDHIRTQGHSLTFTADATDTLSFKSISAYREFKQSPSAFDLGASGGLLFTRPQLLGLITPGLSAAQRQAIINNPANRPGPTDHFFSIFNAYKNHQQQVSQEFQGSLTTDAFNLIAGVFYFHESNPTTNMIASLATFANGVYVPSAPRDTSVTRLKTDNDAFAFYAQGTLHATDQLDLTGGIRYSIDDRGTYIYELSGAQVGSIGVGNFKATFNRTNYTAIVTWRPTDQITSYAKVSTAYVAGGIYAGTRFEPEDVTAYELGLKTQLFDNRLRANFAVYQNDYKDLQTQVFANGVSTITNAGKARIKGAEAELEFAVTRGLTLSGNLSVVDFNYRKFILNGVDVASIAAQTSLSKYTGRASVAYSGPEFANGSHGIARLDVNYRSKLQLGPLSILDRTGAIAPLNDFVIAKGAILVDGRLGLADIPVGGGSISVSAFGQNLFDEQYTLYGASVAQLVRGNERGRTYGVELGFRF